MASPAGGGGDPAPGVAARKVYNNVKYNSQLDAAEFSIGYVVQSNQTARKSGREAWSERVQEELVEVPFPDFDERAVPFHVVKFFRHQGQVIWDCRNAFELGGARHGSPGQEAGAKPGSSPPVRGSPSSYGSFGGRGQSLDKYMAALNLHRQSAERSAEPGETSERPGSDLPELAWTEVFQRLPVADICRAGAVSKSMHRASASGAVWAQKHRECFGGWPERRLLPAQVQQKVLQRASKMDPWLHRKLVRRDVGYRDTRRLQFDNAKAVTADGQSIRVWVPESGRRIQTLKGHSTPVTALGYDAAGSSIVSGDVAGALKFWHMDSLELRWGTKGHDGPVTGLALTSLGLTVSSGEDGVIGLWEAAGDMRFPIMEIDTGEEVRGVHVEEGGSSSTFFSYSRYVDMWDLNTCQQIGRAGGIIADEDLSESLAFEEDRAAPVITTAVASNAGLLASAGFLGVDDLPVGASAGDPIVCLWDKRNLTRVCSFHPGHDDKPAPDLNYLTPPGHGAAAMFGCTGLHLDDWKLASAFFGSRRIAVFDIRKVSGGVPGTLARLEPLYTLEAPGIVDVFGICGNEVLAGVAGRECSYWSLKRPGEAPAEAEAKAARKGKKGMKPIAKGKRRYPKRQGRG